MRILAYGNDEDADGFSVEDWLSGDHLGGNYASPPGGDLKEDSLVNAGGTHPAALDDRPPVASLYHEMSHAYDQISGGTPDGDYDPLDSDDGSTHPGAFTENALRDDLGWDNRESYTLVPGHGEDVIVRYEDDGGNTREIRIED